MRYSFYLLLFVFTFQIYAQSPGDTVTDFDGNVYESVILGNQTWLAENLKSTHYCDGSEIPDVVSYNNDPSLGDIYWLLYTWNAAMNGSTTPGEQGVCPCGWHVPSDEEWSELETFLGGADIAGGKMKETGLDHWYSPNTGADNTSGLTILAAGEFDASYNPPSFRFLKEYAVFWTSTQINLLKARERAISYNNTKSLTVDWYKTLKYSIRCVKNNSTVAIDNEGNSPNSLELKQNYPNPFNPNTTIEVNLDKATKVSVSLYNSLGDKVQTIYNGYLESGKNKLNIDGSQLPSGQYFYKMDTDAASIIKKCTLIK